MVKVKDKERLLKAAAKKKKKYVHRKPHKAVRRFFSRNFTGQNSMTFKMLKGNNCHLRILCPARLSFRIDGEIKGFPHKQKLMEIITKPALQEMLMVLL